MSTNIFHSFSRLVSPNIKITGILALTDKIISKTNINSKDLTFGIVLTGGGSMLRNLVPLAQEKFNLPVRIGQHKNFSGAVDIASTADYTAAIGLTQWNSVTRDMVMKDVTVTPIGKAVTNIKDWVRGLFT